MPYIKFPSHRMRDHYRGWLANKTGFCSYHRPMGYGVYEATEAEIKDLRATGRARFTVLRPPVDDIFKCWGQ